MLPGIIWGIYVPKNTKDTSKKCYKKIKSDPLVSAKISNYKLIFSFWIIEQLLKALVNLFTEFSFWKKKRH